MGGLTRKRAKRAKPSPGDTTIASVPVAVGNENGTGVSSTENQSSGFDFMKFRRFCSCGICGQPWSCPVELPCGHVFCSPCVNFNQPSTSSAAMCKVKYGAPTSCSICHAKIGRRSVLTERTDLSEICNNFENLIQLFDKTTTQDVPLDLSLPHSSFPYVHKLQCGIKFQQPLDLSTGGPGIFDEQEYSRTLALPKAPKFFSDPKKECEFTAYTRSYSDNGLRMENATGFIATQTLSDVLLAGCDFNLNEVRQNEKTVRKGNDEYTEGEGHEKLVHVENIKKRSREMRKNITSSNASSSTSEFERKAKKPREDLIRKNDMVSEVKVPDSQVVVHGEEPMNGLAVNENSLDSFERDMLTFNTMQFQTESSEEAKRQEIDLNGGSRSGTTKEKEIENVWPHNPDNSDSDEDFLMATPGNSQQDKSELLSRTSMSSQMLKTLKDGQASKINGVNPLFYDVPASIDTEENVTVLSCLSKSHLVGSNAGTPAETRYRLEPPTLNKIPLCPSASVSSTPLLTCPVQSRNGNGNGSCGLMSPAPKVKSGLKSEADKNINGEGSYVFCPTRLSKAQLSKLQDLCNISGGRISKEYSEDVTHLILNLEHNRVPQTMKYLFAIAGKKWIVTFDWVEECLKCDGLVYEDPYETSNFPQCDRGVGISRTSTKSLFQNVPFYIGGHMSSSGATVNDCKKLLVQLGGKIVTNPSEVKEDIIIIGDPLDTGINYQKWFKSKGWLTVSWEWILDCALTFSIVPFSHENLITKIDGANFSQIHLPEPLPVDTKSSSV